MANEDGDKWQIVDGEKPFFKTPRAACGEVRPYNIVVIVLESFRAKSLSLWNPEKLTEATPFLNSLAKSPLGAYYTRFYANGHPTIASFMTIHTGLLPHSTRTVAKSYTLNEIQSFASIAGEHGHHTVFFAGSDPDWDNQRPWLNRWYDRVVFDPKFDEQDRLVMRRLAVYLRQERPMDKPFLATAFLITNHQPFHVREEAFRLNPGKTLSEGILNTMRYDDDVLQEFFETIQGTAWFENTIFIITADHGMDLGDRGVPADYENLRREATHVPLILYGHPDILRRGTQSQLSAHIDLAPTILDMLNICVSNSFMGHSLLNSPSPKRWIASIKSGNFALETPTHSAFFPRDRTPMLFEADDRWQNHDIAANHPDLIEKYRQYSTVVDIAYQRSLFSPPSN